MQEPLFAQDMAVEAAQPQAAQQALAAGLPPLLRLGTSSWHYPGWAGQVWRRAYPEALLSHHGLPAYAAHPLLRTVSLDRSFYRPLSVDDYAALAAQVPAAFRFVVKAPRDVTDVVRRADGGQAVQPNPRFLDAAVAARDFVGPAARGLGAKLGVLVFQLSPLPPGAGPGPQEVLQRLAEFLAALPRPEGAAADAIVAVELRSPALLTPALPALLRAGGATCCLALHPKMPPLEAQLPVLRALWPGPLVCRWNVNRVHGPYGYQTARQRYAPYDRLVDPDLATRSALARVIAGTTRGGQRAYVTISNKAEGSAPQSVALLAEAVAALGRIDHGG